MQWKAAEDLKIIKKSRRNFIMKTGRNYKFWFCTGSQDLYGDECLRKVAEHSRIIVEELNKSGVLPFELVWNFRTRLLAGLFPH